MLMRSRSPHPAPQRLPHFASAFSLQAYQQSNRERFARIRVGIERRQKTILCAFTVSVFVRTVLADSVHTRRASGRI